MSARCRIEGYAIVSQDGMLATAARVMPDTLLFDADQRFFEAGLDGVDVVVHGRHSQERQTRSPLRHRLILTRGVEEAVYAEPDQEHLGKRPRNHGGGKTSTPAQQQHQAAIGRK